ncbi:MAG: DUF58 domain-containing protein, partial [Flavobacteriales bacterium]|nr:DUF58 domain-containing protein [Flavobacteriales bacterium]
LRITARKHDVVAIRTVDPGEAELPNAGWVLFHDNESGALQWVNTSSSKNRKALNISRLEHNAALKDTFSKAGVDAITVQTDKPYVQPLMNLFKRRGA